MIYLKNSVGVEIRQEDLLISCLKSNFAGGVFTSFKRVAGYRQRDQKEVAGEIEAFFKQERVNRHNIVLGLPRSDIIFRYLDLPKEVEDNLKQVVLYQVQSFEPTEEEKLYYDYLPIRNGLQASKRLHILLVMVRKSILDSHLEFMRLLGIRPIAITTGSVALANMFLGTHNDGRGKTFVLADIKPGGIELAVLRNGMVVYGKETTRPGEISWKELLLGEIELAVGKARLEPDEDIESIVMSGEASAGARQEILDELPGCELIGDRLRFEMPAKNKGLLQEAATSLALAYSGIARRLAMKLNLLPMERRIHQQRWAYIPTIIFALGIVVLLVGLAIHQVVQEKSLVSDLDQQIAKLQGPANAVRNLQAQSLSLEKQIVSLEDILRRRDQNLEILQELTTRLPSDTYLTFYRNNDCSINLNGQSPPSSSSDLIPKLEQSPLLKDVATTGTIFKNQQTGKDNFQFTAKCEK